MNVSTGHRTIEVNSGSLRRRRIASTAALLNATASGSLSRGIPSLRAVREAAVVPAGRSSITVLHRGVSVRRSWRVWASRSEYNYPSRLNPRLIPPPHSHSHAYVSLPPVGGAVLGGRYLRWAG